MKQLTTQSSQRVFTPLRDRVLKDFPAWSFIQAVGLSVLTLLSWPYLTRESRRPVVVVRGGQRPRDLPTGTQQRIGQLLFLIGGETIYA